MTVCATELLDHGGIDEFVAVARAMLRALITGVFSICDTDGVEHRCEVDEGWKGANLLGPTLDLPSAYKQLAVAEEDLNVALTCVYDVDSAAPRFWVNQALPFGSSGSVYGFNKCSRCLERVLTGLGVLFCSSYVDDFPLIEPDVTARSASLVVESILSLLGWVFDKRGHKYTNYGRKISLLGTEVEFKDEVIVVSNTERRLSHIAHECEIIKEAGFMLPGDASRLVGRLNFVRSFVEGKPINSLIFRLHEVASQRLKVSLDESDLAEVLDAVMEYPSWSSPRRVPPFFNRSRCILYTDGSLEGNHAGIGAVLFCGSSVEYIQMVVPVDVLERWKNLGTRHSIAQVELCPVLIAKMTWDPKLKGNDILHFTDNDSVKEAIVKGSSANLITRSMLYTLASIDLRLQGRSWTARVPTQSNPADWPSRGEADKLQCIWPCHPAVPRLELMGLKVW